MEPNNKNNTRDELATIKQKTEREINELVDLKNRAKKVESDVHLDIEADLRNLSSLQELLAYDRVDVGDSFEQIRMQIKQYDESSLGEDSGRSSSFDKRIAQLEDTLEEIRRKV